MTQVHEALETVTKEVAEAQTKLDELTTTWQQQCGSGLFDAAEATEEAMAKTKGLVARLIVQRTAVAAQVAQVEADAAAAHKAGLVADADAKLADLVVTLDSLAPLAADLAEKAAAFEARANAWRETVHFVKAAGATCTGFTTQENTAKVRAFYDSVIHSGKVVAGTEVQCLRVTA